MERARAATEAMLVTLVEVTPAALREFANQLELSSQRATSTETVLVKFTDRICFAYKPSVKTVDQLKEKAGAPEAFNLIKRSESMSV